MIINMVQIHTVKCSNVGYTIEDKASFALVGCIPRPIINQQHHATTTKLLVSNKLYIFKK